MASAISPGVPKKFCHSQSMTTPLTPLQKRCSTCLKIKPRGWFSKSGSGRYRSQCRDCMRPKRSADAAKRRGAGVTKVSQDILERLYVRQRGLCGICHLPVGLLRKYWHVDHKHPLSKGGRHEESNLQVTHPRCNLIKSNKVMRPS